MKGLTQGPLSEEADTVSAWPLSSQPRFSDRGWEAWGSMPRLPCPALLRDLRSTLPVKLMPHRCSELVTVSPKVGPSAGTNWMMLGQPGLPEDAVDGIAGQHGGVAGLPQDHVALSGRHNDDSQG